MSAACPECGFDLRDDACGACAFRRARMENRREALRREMDRPPSWRAPGLPPAWQTRWFSMDGEFLGSRSERTRPDPVDAKQKCPCLQCTKQPEPE